MLAQSHSPSRVAYRTLRLILVASSLVGVLESTAVAATSVTWTGGTSSTWSVGNNWTGNSAPANDLTTNTALFDSTTYTNQPTVATAQSVAGIIDGDGTTLTGNLTITETA